MKRSRHQLRMLIALLVLFLMPQLSLAAPNDSPSQAPTVQGLELKLDYVDGVYTVYARPDFSTEVSQFLLGAQITIRAPHALDAARFAAVNITSPTASVEWLVTSRVDAPTENQAADYLSFTLEPLTDVAQEPYEWSAGQEIELFRFENSGTCLGTVAIMEKTDPFYLPVAGGGYNSVYTDPSNSFIVADQGDANLHDIYSGTYAGVAPDCGARNIEVTPRIYLPLVNR